ncbi:MAG: FtsW/RodA/SpoVE family cell cycle protein [Bryobacteraceae bacterium]
MAQRVKMDWVLFWTILGMVAMGLVMVYSASSVLTELSEKIARNANSARVGLRIGAALGGALVLYAMIRRWRQDALPLTWAFVGLSAVALLQLLAYWIAQDQSAHYAFLLRQGAAALAGFFALVLISQRDYRDFRSARWAFAALGIVIFLLILACIADTRQHRWIRLGISIQPSEFAKPALIVFLAWFVTLRRQAINTSATVWPVAIALTMMAGLVVIGDFGTAVVLVVTAAAIFYLAGLNRRYILSAIGIGSILLMGAIAYRPYRLLRLILFVDPEYKYLVVVDPGKKMLHWAEANSPVKDTSYHGLQSKIAIGAGGVVGLGIMESRQKMLFLPEAHTDFIYAIVAEELGLWGASLILAGFLVILWRGYQLYFTAADDFGRYLAIGVTTTLVFQALLNMSVVLDLGPTKGIPLPLISFGGSSMLSTMISLGLLLSVSQRASHAG